MYTNQHYLLFIDCATSVIWSLSYLQAIPKRCHTRLLRNTETEFHTKSVFELDTAGQFVGHMHFYRITESKNSNICLKIKSQSKLKLEKEIYKQEMPEARTHDGSSAPEPVETAKSNLHLPLGVRGRRVRYGQEVPSEVRERRQVQHVYRQVPVPLRLLPSSVAAMRRRRRRRRRRGRLPLLRRRLRRPQVVSAVGAARASTSARNPARRAAK